MDKLRRKKVWSAGIVCFLLLLACLWRFGPRTYQLKYQTHTFEYTEPPTTEKNRGAELRVWVGYSGMRPHWWGQRVNSRIDDGHDWSFSNGVNVQGGGGVPSLAQYDEETDSYRYNLTKGLTAYQVKNGEMVAVADGLATQCRLNVSFDDPQKGVTHQIPMTLKLTEKSSSQMPDG